MPVRDAFRRRGWWPPILAIATLACLLSPAGAAAAEFTVDSTLDEPDASVGVGGCLTAGLKCTLRAAIQESNSSTGVKDTIKFAAAFDGQLADTIALGPSFPVITDFVTIDGDGVGQCATAASVAGPCVGVSGPSGGFGLVVEDDDVTIEGLAVTGALTGISVINGSEEFVARNNWLGVKLDGTAGANNTGIFLDPTSHLATIGGTTAAARNVFAGNNNEGLDIEGSSGAVVRGNYFGVKPDGVTQAGNGKNVELTDSTAGSGFEAIDNEIGGGVSPAQAASVPCDGGCNVISGSLSAGIDMAGVGANEAPPTGPTTIQGNYVGIDAAGAAGLGNTTTGILVGGADEALIGGSGEGEANHVNGGVFGILAGKDADDLVLDGNLIGLNAAGTGGLTSPSSGGIVVSSEGVAAEDAAEITDNRFSMDSGIAIEQHGTGALISGNSIGGAANQFLFGAVTGIRLYGDNSIQGSTIEANVIENSTENAIQIENDDNLVIGNVIEGAGGAGIRIQPFGGVLPSTGNSIGGNTANSENAISESGGDAIEVAGAEDDETLVARNFGDSNGGLFIDLGADGPGNAPIGGPNEGIQAPSIATATVSGATGSGALPAATIRVFRKATTAAGELESFLGEATADGSGNWSISYAAPIPGGTPIAATQTGSGFAGTSELTIATTVVVIEDGGCAFIGGPGCTGGNGGGTGGGSKDDGKDKDKSKVKKPKADKKAPETTIVKGPRRKSHKRTARFKFVSSEPNSTFQCKLDRRPFKRCRSPKRYRRLKPGMHVFKVRAIDAAGNVDKSPATRRFRVLD